MNGDHRRRIEIKWQRHLPIFLVLIGAGSVAVVLVYDLVSDYAGLGPKQITLIAVGAAVLLSGFVLATPTGWSFLIERRALAKMDAGPASLLLIGGWFGLFTGWVEAVVMFIRELGNSGISYFHMDFLWMAPLANLILFIIIGLILSLVGWRWPKFISLQTATFIFAFLALLSSLLLLFPRLHNLAVALLAAGLALQIARVYAIHPKELHVQRASQAVSQDAGSDYRLGRRQFLIGAGATLASMAIGVQGYHRLAEHLALTKLPSPAPNLPNILLVVLDSVRAQNLSLYGYLRPTTPQLERLAGMAVRFDKAIATAPWTLPSHAGMFTGRWHHELSTDWTTPLDATYPTLAEALSAYGYLTAGFVANLSYCSRASGLNRGFTHYEDFPISPGHAILDSSLGRTLSNSDELRRVTDYHELLNRKNAARINRDFLRWLSRNERRPFFAFLNYFDAHEPYLPPSPFDEVFGPSRAGGDFVHSTDGAERPDKWKMSPELVQMHRNGYDGAIAYIDHHLGLLFDELGKRNALENTLVLITSDHGEQLGEHGLFGHSNSLYLPTLHVPLLIIFPSHIPAGISIPKPVSLRDIPATVVDLVGLSKGARFPGRSLKEYWDGTLSLEEAAARPLLSQINSSGLATEDWYPTIKGNLKSLVINRYHYIKNGDDSEELYDFENDPWETQDLVATETGRRSLATFRASLEMILAQKLRDTDAPSPN